MTRSLFACAVALCLGCSQAPPADSPAAEAPVVEQASLVLCGACGQLKGAEACCADGADACAECALHKGAPGCCKIDAGEDVTLCGGCGYAKGGELCCAEGAELCATCGMHAGAPGCCLEMDEEGVDMSDAADEETPAA